MSVLFRDADRDRLLRRITAVAGGDLTTSQIDHLIDGDVKLLTSLPPLPKAKVAALVDPDKASKLVAPGELESIVGSTVDYVPIAFLDRARSVAGAVVRILDGKRRPLGTGVMVSPRLLLTNHHVIEDPQAGASCCAQFNYQLGVDDVPEVVNEFGCVPSDFFWTSPVEELDVTLIAIGAQTAGDQSLTHFGWTALSSAMDKHAEGDFVTLIQHPDADYKQIALRENRVIGRGAKGTTIYYAADTLRGSSGCPVFNDDFDLVALHHAGGPRNDTTFDTGAPITEHCNEGIRVSSIVEALRARHDTLPPGFRDLLAEALNPPISAQAGHSFSTSLETSSAVINPGTRTPKIVAAELHLPRLEISAAHGWGSRAGLGLAATPPLAITDANKVTTRFVQPAVTGALSAVTLERNDAPEENFANRRGYDPDFLSVSVPIPSVPTSLLKRLAAPHGHGIDKASALLHYHHFSLAVRADRRMPLFTIVNIDGRRLRSINRKTGEIGEIESVETWFTDPRLEPTEQLDQSVFDKQRPRLFDRGHLVRRLDPAWGSPSSAKAAADDTFHFTNCCPQIMAFNQHLWQGIENYALDNAGSERRRISVITGPVFTDQDPEYRAVPVPQAFWKIVVRVSDTDGQLRVTGFLADQKDALHAALQSGQLRGIESFADVRRVSMHQSSVADIARLSGLKFGDLAHHDTQQVGLESLPAIDTLMEVAW